MELKMSVRVTTPTSLPSSMTGRRCTSCLSMSAAQSRTEHEERTNLAGEVIHSPTVSDGLAPVRSRSLREKMPTTWSGFESETMMTPVTIWRVLETLAIKSDALKVVTGLVMTSVTAARGSTWLASSTESSGVMLSGAESRSRRAPVARYATAFSDFVNVFLAADTTRAAETSPKPATSRSAAAPSSICFICSSSFLSSASSCSRRSSSRWSRARSSSNVSSALAAGVPKTAGAVANSAASAARRP
mmetsp:Transcript_25734/g.84716  ORF Transcript_25734/g.84716 Transcript_25734/m.84716 type:complete len:246 (+) Transcript_25734:175-912(+)